MSTDIDDTRVSVAMVERLMPGRAAAMIAKAWEVEPAEIKATDRLRLKYWVIAGVPRQRLISAIQRAQLDALR